MQMEAGLDTGPMLLKRTVPITGETTGGRLHDDLAALGGAVALTLALTLALTAAVVLLAPPDGFRAEVPLRAAEGTEQSRLSHAELIRRLEDSGVAAAVDIVGLDGAERLVLSGIQAAESAEVEILNTLSGGGYRPDAVEFTREVDPVDYRIE